MKVPPELKAAADYAARQPAPKFIVQRVAMLHEFVHAKGFPRSRADKFAALDEIVFLRRELIWQRYLQMRVMIDRSAWEDAVRWIESDTAEVEADTLETMMRSVPRRPKESDTRYLARLQTIRRSFAASLGDAA